MGSIPITTRLPYFIWMGFVPFCRSCFNRFLVFYVVSLLRRTEAAGLALRCVTEIIPGKEIGHEDWYDCIHPVFGTLPDEFFKKWEERIGTPHVV